MSAQLLHSKLQRELDLKASRASGESTRSDYPPTPPTDQVSDASNDVTPPEFDLSYHSPASSVDDDEPEPSTLVAVIGVGYVGTHLVEAFAHHYPVLAFDVSDARLKVVDEQFRQAGLSVTCTSRPQDLTAATHFLISVPTVLNHDKTIDTTYLRAAVATVEQYARAGSTVVIESSVAVGMTRTFLGPLMTSKNFLVGMSPERVDPGRTTPAFETIPKIISGLSQPSLHSINALYARVFTTIHPVSSPEVAEMTKLYENCQRMVLAAYANEMADACTDLNIDPWEVSSAAASKPFGYSPFKPGAGVGGHCIPVNPYYLLSNCDMPVLQRATERSWGRPERVAERFMGEVVVAHKHRTQHTATPARRPRVLVVGMGFKRGQSVMSNSPGVAIVGALLATWDVYVEFADPLVAQDRLAYVPKMETETEWSTAGLESFDGVVVAMNQVGLDMGLLKGLEGVVVHNYCPQAVA